MLKWPIRTKFTIKHLYLPYAQIERPLTETYSLFFKQKTPARTKQKVRVPSVQIYKLCIILLGCLTMICSFTYIHLLLLIELNYLIYLIYLLIYAPCPLTNECTLQCALPRLSSVFWEQN